MPIVSDLFAGIVGAASVRPADAAEAVRGVMPQFVVEPADAGEVSRVLSAASGEGLAVIPRGGGTKLEWGSRPRRADIILSLRRLDRVVEHAWADLTVTVQAGCTVGALQRTLAEHGQRVAADPLWPDRATVGGMLSTNDAGAWRLRFGGLRDLVIGTTLALSDGTLASSGGKVVKNVAGYDLSKLATGAFGTLGVITSAIFRLHPCPREARSLSATCERDEDVQRIIDSLLDSRLALTALQVRSGSSASRVLDVLLEGTAAGLAAQTGSLQTIAGSSRFQDAAPDVWRARDALWTGTAPRAIVKISAPPAELARVLGQIRLCEAAGFRWSAVLEATGIGWVELTGPATAWPDLLRRLRAAMIGMGGSLVVLHPWSPDAADDVWGEPGDAQTLMAAVKQQFNPAGTLNPGRFVGHI